jgi:hypothetical protein
VLSWLRAQLVAAVLDLLFEELETTISMQSERFHHLGCE